MARGCYESVIGFGRGIASPALRTGLAGLPLTRTARESGIETPTTADVIRLDRNRKGKKLSNADWKSPTDPDARIAKLKDGRTHLARAFPPFSANPLCASESGLICSHVICRYVLTQHDSI